MKLQELVPAALQKKYGNVFLGEYPLFVDLQHANIESNTELETQFIKIVKHWVLSGKEETGIQLYQ
jgi:hypothetical protein